MSSKWLAIIVASVAWPAMGADEEEIIKNIKDAREKALPVFVGAVIKAPPRQLEIQDFGKKDERDWYDIAQLISQRVSKAAGQRYVMDKNYGLEDLSALNELREWLLKSESCYLNLSCAVVAGSTIARTSMALLAEDGSNVRDVKRILAASTDTSVKISSLLEVAEKKFPNSVKVKEFLELEKVGQLVDLYWVAEQLSLDLQEVAPAMPNELISSTRPAGLAFALWATKRWEEYARLTCKYLEKGGKISAERSSLIIELKARMPEAFAQRNSLMGAKIFPDELADEVLSALSKRN